MRRFVLSAAFAACASSAALASCPFSDGGDIRIVGGILKGTDLMNYSDGSLLQYSIGFMNGMSMAAMLGGAPSCVAKFSKDCFQGRTAGQISAIIRKYLKDNPEQWHLGANALSWRAITATCG